MNTSVYSQIKYIISEIPYIVRANKINARYLDIPAKKQS